MSDNKDFFKKQTDSSRVKAAISVVMGTWV